MEQKQRLWDEKQASAVELEIAGIERQQRRFAWLSLLAIVVSFIHMASALALFSRAEWYERAAALAMTGLVDVATWIVAGYLDFARRQRSRSRWAQILFAFALVISMFLNGAYLYANRPSAEILPEWMSVCVALAFAVFVPMLIGVAALIRGDLENQRLELLVAQTNDFSLVAQPAFDAAPERDNEHNVALQEKNTAVQLPSPQVTNDQAAVTLQPTNSGTAPPAQPRSATNGKALLATNDVAGMLRTLRQAQVREFANARELARLCGWASSSSGPRALRALLDAGAVVQRGETYFINWPEEESHANSYT